MRTAPTVSAPLALISLFAAAAARADDCSAALDAALKLNDTPYHMRMTMTGGLDKLAHSGQPKMTDMIVTADTMYMNVNGKWHTVPKDPANADDIRKELDASTAKCQYLRDEAVDGVDAAVYHIDNTDPDAKSAETIWIGKDSGLILRMNVDMDVGGGDMGKNHMESTFDYQDVAPPPGVK